MASRDKLIIVYSRVGWEKLTSLIGSSVLTSWERKLVVDTINDNDAHHIEPRGAHLLYFDSCNTSSDSMQMILTSLNGRINSAEWFVHMLLDNGDEDSFGGYYNNSFSPGIKRQLVWETHNTMIAQPLSIVNAATAAPIATPSVVVNNHTCPTCGNTACSRNEIKCWKCGNPL